MWTASSSNGRRRTSFERTTKSRLGDCSRRASRTTHFTREVVRSSIIVLRSYDRYEGQRRPSAQNCVPLPGRTSHGGSPHAQWALSARLRARRLRRGVRRGHARPAQPRMVRMGLDSLCHLEHRGASGAEVNTGDGAGILIQIPDAFYRAVAACDLPAAGCLRHRHRLPAPRRDRGRPGPRRRSRSWPPARSWSVLGWREVPVDDSMLGQHRPQRHAGLPPGLRRRSGRRNRAWTSSGGRSSCASGSSTRSRGSTSPPCRPAPWSTRAC